MREARDGHFAKQPLAALLVVFLAQNAHPLHRVVLLVGPVARLEHPAEAALAELPHVLEVFQVPARTSAHERCFAARAARMRVYYSMHTQTNCMQ